MSSTQSHEIDETQVEPSLPRKRTVMVSTSKNLMVDLQAKQQTYGS